MANRNVVPAVPAIVDAYPAICESDRCKSTRLGKRFPPPALATNSRQSYAALLTMAANRMRKKAVLCPVCGGAEHFPVLSRRGVPTLLNRSYDSISAALSAPTGELDIVACPTCGLTFNKSFDASLTGYSTSYEN